MYSCISIGFPHTVALMYKVLERDFECVEMYTVRRWHTQTMGWYHGWFSRHCFFFLFCCFLITFSVCSPLCHIAQTPSLFPFRMSKCTCMRLCMSVLFHFIYKKFVFDFFLLLGFSFHLYWTARRFVLHMYMYIDSFVMSAHTDCRLYGPMFQAYFFPLYFHLLLLLLFLSFTSFLFPYCCCCCCCQCWCVVFTSPVCEKSTFKKGLGVFWFVLTDEILSIETVHACVCVCVCFLCTLLPYWFFPASTKLGLDKNSSAFFSCAHRIVWSRYTERARVAHKKYK